MAKSRPSNRTKQLNPQHDSYWQSRGWAARPFMALVDPPPSLPEKATGQAKTQTKVTMTNGHRIRGRIQAFRLSPGAVQNPTLQCFQTQTRQVKP